MNTETTSVDLDKVPYGSLGKSEEEDDAGTAVVPSGSEDETQTRTVVEVR